MNPPPFAPPVDVALDHGRGYPVHFVPLTAVPALLGDAGLPPGRVFVVTDANVAPLYGGLLEDALRDAGWTPRVEVLPAGERTKSMRHLQHLYDAALGWGIDRTTPVLALGGGVVGDLAGFAAATLLRGLPLVQVPTSLIAQVDSALGGKTGLNHAVGKNLVGAFHQPRFVAADLATLQSLPEREWTSGLAEVVKHGLIAGGALFDRLEAERGPLWAREEDVVARVVPPAAAVKARIVAEDEREQGRRAVLNLGHTFGHAVERVAGYGTFTHGEAVALGLRAAIHLSAALHPEADFARARRLVAALPTPDPGTLALDALVTAMQADKKVERGRLRFVLLRRVGDAYVRGDVPEALVRAAWAHVGVTR